MFEVFKMFTSDSNTCRFMPLNDVVDKALLYQSDGAVNRPLNLPSGKLCAA